MSTLATTLKPGDRFEDIDGGTRYRILHLLNPADTPEGFDCYVEATRACTGRTRGYNTFSDQFMDETLTRQTHHRCS